MKKQVLFGLFLIHFSLTFAQKTYEYKSLGLLNSGIGIGAFKPRKFIGVELSGITFLDRQLYIPQSKKAYFNPFGAYVGFIYLIPEMKLGYQLTKKWHNLSRVKLDIAQDVTNYTLGTHFIHTGDFVFKSSLPINIGIDYFNTKASYANNGQSKRTNYLHFFGGISVAKRIKISNSFYIRPSVETNFKSYLELVEEIDKNYQYRVIDNSSSSINLALLYHHLYFEMAYWQQSNYYGDKIGNHTNYRNKLVSFKLKYLLFNDITSVPKFIF